MNWIDAVILGLVEGITEYLPISSTGHLILVSALLGLNEPEVKRSVDAFNIVIQGGAILAVLGLYWPRVLQMIRGVLGKDRAGRKLAINLFIAFLPAAVLGVLLDDWIESKLFYPGPVIGALAVGGIYMMLLERWRKGKLGIKHDKSHETQIENLTAAQAVGIGFLQCIAMWPGTSRSMMTITGGMLMGLKPKQAAEFSFLLGLPTLGGATVYKLAKNLKYASDNGTENLFEQLGVVSVLIGIVVAAVSAALAVKWLVSFLNKHGLTLFGWYRLVLSAVLLTMITMGAVQIQPEEPAKETPVFVDEN